MADDYDMQDMAGWADRATANGGNGAGGEAEGEGEEGGGGPTTPEQLTAEVDAALEVLKGLKECADKVELPEGEDDVSKKLDELKDQLTEMTPVLEDLSVDLKAIPEPEPEEGEEEEESEGEEEQVPAEGG